MNESIISEGKTTEEAISNGLKTLRLSRDQVEIKVLEEPSKRLFSILAPRVVKVELKPKKNIVKEQNKVERKISKELLEETEKETKDFLEQFFVKLNRNVNLNTEIIDSNVFVHITGDNLGNLIGYRGEVLDSLQTILNSSISKAREEHIKILVDIENYRKKREKTLQNLAKSIANTVIKEKKSITLEPMTALERKIIHSALQNSNKVETVSIGEEPYRKVVISLKK